MELKQWTRQKTQFHATTTNDNNDDWSAVLHNEPICRAAKCPKSPVRAQQSTHYQAATRKSCFYLTLPKHHHLFTHSMNDKTNKRNKMCGAASSAQNFSAPVSGCGKSPIIAFGCLHNSPSAPHHQIKHFKRLTRMCFEAAGITAVLEVFHWSFKAFSKDFLKLEASETAYEK